MFKRCQRKGIEFANMVIKEIDLKLAKAKKTAMKATKTAKAGNPPKKASKPTSKVGVRKRRTFASVI